MSSSVENFAIGIDIGGTFTDVALVDESSFLTEVFQNEAFYQAVLRAEPRTPAQSELRKHLLEENRYTGTDLARILGVDQSLARAHPPAGRERSRRHTCERLGQQFGLELEPRSWSSR